MIIGKRDKERVKQLEERNRFLENDFAKSIYKDELMNVIKAIINKFETKEITITDDELYGAKQYEIYVTEDILRFAKKYQLINPKKLLHKYKEA